MGVYMSNQCAHSKVTEGQIEGRHFEGHILIPISVIITQCLRPFNKTRCLSIRDLRFNLPRSWKVILKAAILKVIYSFLLVFNSSNPMPQTLQ